MAYFPYYLNISFESTYALRVLNTNRMDVNVWFFMKFHLLDTPNESTDSFNQDKYNFFKHINLMAVIVCCISEMIFFIADCLLCHGFSSRTFVPRFIIIIPLLIFLFAYKKIKSYKIIIPLSYIITHICVWETIWALANLNDKYYAGESFIIMQLMFLGVGMCAPIRLHIVFHSLLVVDILASYPINNYDKLDLMLAFAVPCIIGILIFLYIFEKVYSYQRQQQKKLEFLSVHDQLTGLYNRTKLNEFCKPETNEFTFEKCGIILFDIDYFKSINDTYGHDAGDTVLSQLSSSILTCIRDNDCCIRWGGEEFVVLIPEQGLARTKEIAERIRTKIERSERFIRPITISAGVTIYNGGDYHEAFINADKALYFSKENGRNMVVAYEDL